MSRAGPLNARTLSSKNRYHLTVLMAEQNFNQATKIADRGYIVVHGQIAFEADNQGPARA